MRRRWPRKTKKAIMTWVCSRRPIHLRERRRVVRWLQFERRQNGMPPMRMRPDGRYSLLDI